MTIIDITTDALMYLNIITNDHNINLNVLPVDTIIVILNMHNIPYRVIEYDKNKEVCLVQRHDMIFGTIVKSDKDCSICLDDFKTNKKVIKLSCQHIFHEKCLFDTIKYNNSCPMCRAHIQVFLR